MATETKKIGQGEFDFETKPAFPDDVHDVEEDEEEEVENKEE